MINKHFCQGPNCHTRTTQDRFLKSRGVIRGRYAYSTIDRKPNSWGWTPHSSDVYFCSQTCKLEWLSHNMKTLNRADQSSLLDTGERVVVMTRSRTKIVGVENIVLKELTIGPN
jgi:hypothetical protein